MVWTIDARGWISGDASITPMPRPKIEHGPLSRVNGIIVHQTDSATAHATLNGYLNGGAGAHFLIDKNGKTYQVASLKQKTWHIGKLKAKCIASHSCSAAEFKLIRENKYQEVNRVEMYKSTPIRFPSNSDSIGIELVGQCILDPKFIKPGMDDRQKGRQMGEHGVFEEVTPAQNAALAVLIQNIQSSLHVPATEIYSHPEVSMKNLTEASTAHWAGRK